MKDGPDIALVASTIGDPARANMIEALMTGTALTATELAREAGIGAATASGHLARLESCALVTVTKRGRHRFYRIANSDVAEAIEALSALAARAGHLRTRPGPRDEAMRHARTCYDHLAGQRAVAMFDHWTRAGVVRIEGNLPSLTPAGRRHLSSRGLDLEAVEGQRRPACRICLDWSERLHHLGGGLGAAVLNLLAERRWAVREPGSRTVRFSPRGEARFIEWYSV